MTSLHGIFFTPPIYTVKVGEQLAEVWKEKIYAPYVTGRKDLVILDIGANIGSTAYFFSHYAKKVYALEPAQEHFAALEKMVEFNKLKNVIPINKAIYIRNEKQVLWHYSNRSSYTLIEIPQHGNYETVETITLKSLFDEYKIGEVDLMKVDIEGGEFDLFGHSDFQELAPKIKKVIFETHTWSNRNPQQLWDSLKNAGYTVKQVYEKDANLYLAERI